MQRYWDKIEEERQAALEAEAAAKAAEPKKPEAEQPASKEEDMTDVDVPLVEDVE